jgi:hypothetical protein
MNIIVKTIYGSRLYGTAGTSSDEDYKGVYMPSKRSIYLNSISKSIRYNTKQDDTRRNDGNDVDLEFYSLHYFLKLAGKGETAALDMLHAPEDMVLISSDLWKRIVAERHRFYTKNLTALVGFARTQAIKYGCKGDRLNAAKTVYEYCKNIPKNIRLRDVWDTLPVGEHIVKHPSNEDGIRMYEVCDRKIHETASVNYLHDMVEKIYTNYGIRAERASKNEGIDFKAVSHALKAAYQVKEILVDKTLTFPLKEAEFLKAVKTGKLHFEDEVKPVLNSLMDEIEIMTKNSDLPEQVDMEYWNDFLYDAVGSYLDHDMRSVNR